MKSKAKVIPEELAQQLEDAFEKVASEEATPYDYAHLEDVREAVQEASDKE